MRNSLLPIMLVVAATAAFIMIHSMQARKAADAVEKAQINQRMTARFAAFEALDQAIRKYEVGHGGQIPATIDDAVNFSPELFPADLMQRDSEVNHNLKQTVLLTKVHCARPGDGMEFDYAWVIFLYVPKETMPQGFPQLADFVRWSGEASTASGWPAGFMSVTQAGQYFVPGVIDAAKEKVLGARATTEPAGI